MKYRQKEKLFHLPECWHISLPKSQDRYNRKGHGKKHTGRPPTQGPVLYS